MQRTEEIGELLGEQAREPVSIKILPSAGTGSILSAIGSGKEISKRNSDIREILRSEFVGWEIAQETLDRLLADVTDKEIVKKFKCSAVSSPVKGRPANQYELMLAGHFSLWLFQRFVREVLILVAGMSTDAYKKDINLKLVVSPLNILVLAMLYNNKKPMRAREILSALNDAKSVHTKLNGVDMTMQRITAVLYAMKGPKKRLIVGSASNGYKVARGKGADRFLMTIKFFRALSSFWEKDITIH